MVCHIKKKKSTLSFLTGRNLCLRLHTNTFTGSLHKRYQQAWAGGWTFLSLLLFRLLMRSSTQTWDFGEVGGSMETNRTHRTPMGISINLQQYAPDPVSFSTRREHTAMWLDNTESHPILFLYISMPSICWDQNPQLLLPISPLTLFLLVYQISLWKPKWKSLWFRQKLSSPL